MHAHQTKSQEDLTKKIGNILIMHAHQTKSQQGLAKKNRKHSKPCMHNKQNQNRV